MGFSSLFDHRDTERVSGMCIARARLACIGKARVGGVGSPRVTIGWQDANRNAGGR
jgi:hypothetical protein